MASNRKWQIAAIVLLAVLLAPGTWLRTAISRNSDDRLVLLPLETELPRYADGGVQRVGIWELRSPHSDFGGYSALLRLNGDMLRAFSDRGTRLNIPIPGAQAIGPARFSTVWDLGPFSKQYPDIESATRDPTTGDYWLGFENFNAIARFDVGSRLIEIQQPAIMQDWPVNSGAEAMTRLADGRFIILPESSNRALLFPSDPIEAEQVLQFQFALPEGYFATDMGNLPGGRVLILLRSMDWSWPPFSARLMVADPAQISETQVWQGEELAQLDDLLPRENYEGMAVDPQADGSIVIWLISDDNLAALQRSLLVKLRWEPNPPEADSGQ